MRKRISKISLEGLSVVVLLLVALFSTAVAQQPSPTPGAQIQPDVKPENDELSSLQKALSDAINSKDRAQEAKALNQIGIFYQTHNEFAKSIEYFNRALPVYVAVGDKVSSVIVGYNIAIARYRQGDKDLAVNSLNATLKQFRALGENAFAARILNDLADISAAGGDRATAIKYRQESLSMLQALTDRDDAVEARVMARLFDDYFAVSDFKKAIELSAQLAKAYEATRDQGNLAILIYSIGALQERIGDRKNAIENLTRAIKLCHDTGQKIYEAYSLQLMGRIYNSLGEIKKGVDSLNASYSLFRDLGDSLNMGRVSLDLGIQYISIADYQSADTKIQQALELSTKSGDKAAEAGVWVFKGFLNLYRNRIPEALEDANKGAAVIEQNKLISTSPLTLKTLGSIYLSLGLNEKARLLFEKALNLVPADQENVDKADALLFLGVAYRNLDDFARAEEYLNRALAITRRLGDKIEAITILNSLGTVEGALRKYPDANKHFQEALQFSLEIKNRNAQTVALSNLGNLYAAQPNLDPRALEFLTRALTLARQMGNSPMEAIDLNGLMHYWYDKKNPELAVYYGKQSINIIQSIRSTLTAFEPETQKAYIKQYADSYREFADILIEYGRIAEAENVIAMLKEEEYFDFVRRDNSAADQLLSKISLTPDEQKAFDEYRKYADQLTALGKEHDDLQTESLNYDVGKFPKQTRLDELEKLIENANRVFNIFLDNLKQTLSKEDVRVAGVESGTQSILKRLKEPRTVFVSTVSDTDRLNLILTTASVQKAYAVEIKSGDLNKLVEDFRTVLRNPNIDPRPAGKALFDKLFPAALRKDIDAIKTDTIVWSLDGTLRYIPIAALWDGNKYLVESYRNVVVTLASQKNLTESPSDRKTWKMLGAGVSKATTLTDVAGATRSFDALPAVPDELCRVVDDPALSGPCKSASGGKSGVITGKELLDDTFTRASFTAYVARYPIVHISSHFSLNPGNENDSFLLLGGGEDRKLTLSAIRSGGAQFSSVELLTLSACNTGMASGSRSNGVEVEGLGALAQIAGAKSVLASLWSVADSSTRDLMVEFYRQLESDSKLTKAEALRKAQLTLLYGTYKSADSSDYKRGAGYASQSATGTPFKKDPKAPFTHPYYWSPFILMGNWE